MSKETKSLTLNPKLEAFQKDLLAQYKEKNKTVKKGQILFIGSSIMELFPIEKWQEQGKVQFEHYIYNRAVRATTTQFVLEHLDTQIFDLEPSKIFINIGTNDIGFKVPENIFRENYEKIIKEIQEKLPQTKIYVLKYYPVNTADFGQGQDEKDFLATRSNQAFQNGSQKNQEMSQKLGVFFIDVSQGLSDENGNLRKEYTFDGAHINEKGCEIILSNMIKYLVQ